MTDKKVRWGILSTANIGTKKVIPAMQKGKLCEITAISSRNIGKAEQAANTLGIKKAYGSYEELLNDPDIDSVYNPLPNNYHVPWTIKALEAGKHVLCEKPIGMNTEEAEFLLKTIKKYPKLKVMEAFMYRFHPQWQKAKSLVNDGKIGNVKTIESFFSYYNVDVENIRNKKESGGGGLMDIGCYCISFPRFILDKEPVRVIGTINYDPKMGTDRYSSALLDFSSGVVSSFSCSTQLVPYQQANILGTEGRIEIEIPVNAPSDKSTRIWLITKDKKEEIAFPPVDQYTLQGDAFSKAIIEETDIPIPLTDAVNNMKVIDAIIKSNETKNWIEC
ncbi:MAG: Gfo/Idh/MocA family oxidoreductase [Ignavibacteriaceae bacterium]